MFIIIAYGFRYFQKHNLKYAGSFMAAAALSAYLLNSQQYVLPLFDAFLGVGLVALVFFQTLEKDNDASQALIRSAGIALSYGVLRNLLFRQLLLEQIRKNSQLTAELTTELFADNAELLQLAQQSVATSESFFNSYWAAIWYLVIITALFLGMVWLSQREMESFKISELILPYWFVYPLIISMVFFLLPALRVIGGNMLLMIMPLFLIQGIAVSVYYLKNVVHNRNTLWIMVLLAIFLNYLYLILMVILGISELWLQYRENHRKKIKSMFNEKN
ncbi:MAG: YybS family protein [Candidatus Cloacimonetes bacterium]|nr:YybS family protein [Candidatus Cloacimonadota bacterium]